MRLGYVVLSSALAQLNLLCILVGAGDVLKKLLDQVDVGQDHAAAAVAGEADGIESITTSSQD